MADLINDYQENNDPRQDVNVAPPNLPDMENTTEADIAGMNVTADIQAAEQELVEQEAVTQAMQDNPMSEPMPDTSGVINPLDPNLNAIPETQSLAEQGLSPVDMPEIPELNIQELLDNQSFEAITELQSEGKVAPALYDVNPVRATEAFTKNMFDDIINPGFTEAQQSRNLRKALLNSAGTSIDRVSPYYNPISSSGEGDLTKMELLGQVARYAPKKGQYVHQDGTVFDPTPGVRKLAYDMRTNPLGTIMNIATNPFGSVGSLFRGSKWGDYGSGALGMLAYTLSTIDNLAYAQATEETTEAMGQELRNTDGSYLKQALLGRDFAPTSNRRKDGANLLSFGTGNFKEQGDTIRERAEQSGFWNIISKVVPDKYQDDKMSDKKFLGVTLPEFTEFWAGFGTEIATSPTTYLSLGIIPTLRKVVKSAKGADELAEQVAKQGDEITGFIRGINKIEDVTPVVTVKAAKEITDVPQELVANSKHLNLQVPKFNDIDEFVRSPLSDFTPGKNNLIDPSAIGYTPKNPLVEIPDEVKGMLKTRDEIFNDTVKAFTEVKEANARMLEEAQTLKKHLEYTKEIDNFGRKPVLEDVKKLQVEESATLQKAKEIEWAENVRVKKPSAADPITKISDDLATRADEAIAKAELPSEADAITKITEDLGTRADEALAKAELPSAADEITKITDDLGTRADEALARAELGDEVVEELSGEVVEELITEIVPTGKTWATEFDAKAAKRAEELTNTWYHGTRNGAADLELTKDAIRFGSRNPSGVGLHLTNNKRYATMYSKGNVNINIPGEGLQFSDELGRVHNLGHQFDAILSGDEKLISQAEKLLTDVIAETLDPNISTVVNEAIVKSSSITDMFNKVDEALYDLNLGVLNEAEALKVQRTISKTLQELGYDAIQFKGKDDFLMDELTVLNPEKVYKSLDSEAVPVENFLEQLANKSNAEAITAEKLFPNSKQALRSAADAQATLASQRLYETQKFLREADGVAQKQVLDYTEEYIKRNAEELEKVKNLEEVQKRLTNESSERLAQRSSRELQIEDGGEVFIRIKGKRSRASVSKDIARRMDNLDEAYELTGKAHNSLKEVEARSLLKTQALLDTAMDMRVSELLDLTKNDIGALSHQAAVMFNAKNKAFGLALERSKAGLLRDNILEIKNAGEQVIEEAGRILSLQTVKDIKKLLGKELGDKLPTKELHMLAKDVIEIGAIPKFRSKYGMLPAAEAFNTKRFDDYVQRLTDLGLDKQTIDTLNDKAVVLSNTMDDLRITGKAMGLDMGKTEFLGYIPRYFNPKVKKYLADLQNLDKLSTVKKVTPDTIQETFNKSRKYHHYIPEDDVVLAKMLDMEVDDLRDAVAKGELKGILDNLNDELFEQITDSHVISKIPFSNRELLEAMAERYKGKLPMKLQDELFISDPTVAIENYNDFLKKNASESFAFQRVIGDGLKNGWVVPEESFTRAGSTLNKKDFKKLLPDEVRKFNPTYQPLDNKALYIDKKVFDHLNSVYEFEVNPVFQNAFMQTLNQMSRGMVQGFLMTPQYVLRNLYDGTIAYMKGGGSPTRLPAAIAQYKDITTKGLNALDDTAAVFKGRGGKMVTERELFRQFLVAFGNPKAPGMPAYKKVMKGQTVSPREMHRLLTDPKHAVGTAINHFKNDLEYLTKTKKDFGTRKAIVEGGKELSAKVSNTREVIFSKLADMSSFIETSTKWQLFKDLTDTARKGDKALDVGKAKLNIEDVYISWDETGTAVRGIGKLIPFYSYMYQNIPKTIRHMQRRPLLYKNMFKLYNANMRNLQENHNLNQYETPGFFSENMPLYLSDDKDGTPQLLFMNNFESTADFMGTLDKEAKKFGRVQGRLVGTPQEQARQELSGDSGMRAWFNNMTGDAVPGVKLWAGVLTGVNPDTGRKIEGDRTGTMTDLPPMAEFLLRSIPEINNLVRWNPMGLFGTPELVDKDGNIIAPPKPGLLGGTKTPRVEFDTSKYQNPYGAQAMLGYLGFNVKSIDAIKSTNMSKRDLKRVVGQIGSKLNEIDTLFGEAALRTELKLTNPERYEILKKESEELAAKYIHFSTELLAVELYMKQEGIRDDEALSKLKNKIYKQIWTDNEEYLYNKALKLMQKTKYDKFLPKE